MTDWVRHLITDGGYPGIALLMLLETVFPPIPSEVIMSFAGIASARGGGLALPGVIAAGTAGAMLGNLGWYWLARTLGLKRFRPLIDRFGRWLTVDWRGIERADGVFDRHARWFVCLGRMTPTIRSLVSIPAGLFGMPLRPFLFWSTLGTAGWTGALATGGYWLGTRFSQIDRWLGPASTAVIVMLVAWYLYRVATWKGEPE